jgi:hypothetical protein
LQLPNSFFSFNFSKKKNVSADLVLMLCTQSNSQKQETCLGLYIVILHISFRSFLFVLIEVCFFTHLSFFFTTNLNTGTRPITRVFLLGLSKHSFWWDCSIVLFFGGGKHYSCKEVKYRKFRVKKAHKKTSTKFQLFFVHLTFLVFFLII